MNKVIAISGPSSSGKTTLSKNLTKYFKSSTVIHQDNFYMGINVETGEELPRIGKYKNMEIPQAYDFNELHRVLDTLRSNKPVISPTYSKELARLNDNNKRSTETIHPKKIIIVEGLHPIYDKRIQNLADLSIFLDAPDELILERRLKRDGEIWEEYCREIVIPEYNKLSKALRSSSDYKLNAKLDSDTLTFMMLDFIDRLYQ